MKHLILVLLLSSCSVLDSVKNVFETTYEVGKVRGRQEILDDLTENKKKLKEIKDLVIAEVFNMINKRGVYVEDEEVATDRLMDFVIPVSGNYLILQRERRNLRKELLVAEETARLGKED